MTVLEIENLCVSYDQENKKEAVHNVSLSVQKGESIGIIGESGSGKSTLALTVMGLLKHHTRTEGRIQFKDMDLLALSEVEMESVRWKKIAIIFQNSLDVLNPVISVGNQIAEAIIRHTPVGKKAAAERTKELLAMAGLDSFWFDAYAHQLSGGMRQKILIAMAISCNPEILIADEPTMALDAAAKNEIVQLLKNLQKKIGFSLLIISHELPVIAALTDSAKVMYMGNIMETGKTGDILNNPLHPYTRGLIYASPVLYPVRDMWGIPGEIKIENKEHCPFYSRCTQRTERCLQENPCLEKISEDRSVACVRGGIVTLLDAAHINKSYLLKKRELKACTNCSIQIKSGEVAALIGESGSGKTTLAQILAGIAAADSGEVRFEGRMVSGNSETRKKNGIQMVFQDPFSATNEQMTIQELVQEALDIIKSGTREEKILQVKKALSNVQLPCDDYFLRRRGHTLSGGQRQRAAIARALVMEPKLLIADEISSMLDPSSAANVLRLLKGLQNSQGFAMLYITHDIALAQKISDKVYIMKNGTIIEQGMASDIFTNPRESYTQKLLRGIK